MSTEQQLIDARRRHIEKLQASGGIAYPNDFRPAQDHRKQLCALAQDESAVAQMPGEAEISSESDNYVLFGRVAAKRGPFLVIRTPFGDVQALVRKDLLPTAEAEQLVALDLADHIAVCGPLMKTKTGALALRATTYRHLGKALLPPPAKWHGLTDVEKRYRERYVDLFANPDVTRVFRARSHIISSLRQFLLERDFLEVETPLLHSVRGGATAKPFQTHHNALDLSLFLRIAPELYLKRLLVGGLDRVFEIGRCFRNEGISTRHNPEFTMLEFYQAYADYSDLLKLSKQMLQYVDVSVNEHFPEFCDNRPFRFDQDWPVVTMRESIRDALKHSETQAWHGSLSPDDIFDEHKTRIGIDKLRATLKAPDAETFKKANSYGTQVFALFELMAEPLLTKLYRSKDAQHSLPVYITEYPFEISPLARKNDQDPRFVDRFELYIEGREIANAFSELNDPDDQASRFEAQVKAQSQGDEEAMDFDADYIRALQYGMPHAAGFGLGIDRLVMMFTNQPSIRDVLLFPLLRPEHITERGSSEAEGAQS